MLGIIVMNVLVGILIALLILTIPAVLILMAHHSVDAFVSHYYDVVLDGTPIKFFNEKYYNQVDSFDEETIVRAFKSHPRTKKDTSDEDLQLLVKRIFEQLKNYSASLSV